MKFTYISKDWNIMETEDLVHTPDFLEKIWWTYFEKKLDEKTKVFKSVDIEKEEKEEIKEVEAVIDEDIEARAKEYLKNAKVRGFGLMKGQKLIDKAIELGFII